MVSIKHPDLWTAYKDASQLLVNSQGPSKIETQGKDPLCQFRPSILITNKEFYKRVTLLLAFLKLYHGYISWKLPKET